MINLENNIGFLKGKSHKFNIKTHVVFIKYVEVLAKSEDNTQNSVRTPWNITAKFCMELRECKWCILWHVTEALPMRSLVSKCHVVSQSMHKCNLIYTHTKVWLFPSTFSWNSQIFNSTVSRFLILNIAQNLTTDVQGMDTNSLTLLSKLWLPLLQFSRNLQLQNKFCRHRLHRIWFTVEEKCSKHG